MKKKCSLSLALLHSPQVVFLDEPFEGVDPTSSRNIRDTIHLASSRGCTFFITSHSLEIMELIIDSFAIISHGKIVHQGEVSGLIANSLSLESIYFEHVGNDIVGEIGWLGR
jgi:ABC-2 type transport system ATP-binding protein